MKLPFLLAGLLVTTLTAAQVKPPNALTVDVLTKLTAEAEQLRREVCPLTEGYGRLSFEEVLAGCIDRFRVALHIHLELKGLTIAEKLDKLFPGRGYNANTDEDAVEEVTDWGAMTTDEVFNEMRRLRMPPEERPPRAPIAITKLVVKSCNELHESVRKFNKALQPLVYAVAERCILKCAKDGVVIKAMKELEVIYKGKGFVARVQDAEKDAGCQDRLHGPDLDGNLHAIEKATDAMKEGTLPQRTYVMACQE